jgi:uncharacterized membrane protein
MTVLILGLVLFLGMHSVRIVAEGFRTRFIAQRGEQAWKGLYSVVSVVGFVLIVWGYGLARQQPVALWTPPPTGLRHLAALLTLVAFVFLAAAYVPGNGLKSRLRHPMVLGVKVWALAHLIVNHTLADLLLFGGFLLWAVLDFRAARARDRAQGTVYAAGSMGRTLMAVALGVVLWAAFAFWAHGAWIGISPFAVAR